MVSDCSSSFCDAKYGAARGNNPKRPSLFPTTPFEHSPLAFWRYSCPLVFHIAKCKETTVLKLTSVPAR